MCVTPCPGHPFSSATTEWETQTAPLSAVSLWVTIAGQFYRQFSAAITEMKPRICPENDPFGHYVQYSESTFNTNMLETVYVYQVV